MIQCAIRISDNQWDEWLKPVAQTQRLKNVELDAGLLSEHRVTEALAANGINCLVAQDIVPSQMVQLMMDASSGTSFEDIKDAVTNVMLCGESVNVECFTVQLLLDRFEGTDEQGFIERNAAFLKQLTTAPLEKNYSVAIQVRQPMPTPMSKEWERAVRICDVAKDSRIGLYVHFHPDEWAETGTMEQFIETCYPHLKGICFHYDTRIGETLFDDEQAECARRLKLLDYKGMIVFAPMVAQSAELDKICKIAVSWADFY
ncbi:MAG: hypothetical protein J6X55_13890 [Victivallales bacterium]|nr:hypothetical protein [Victivallales bacterium]